MNPLAMLRKRQKVLLAVFGVLLMIVFTIGGIISSYVGRQGMGAENGVVVRWEGGELREAEMQRMRVARNQMRIFLQAVMEVTIDRGGIPGDPRFQLQGQSQRQMIPMVLQAMLPDSEQGIVQTLLMAKAADDSGMVVSKEAVIDYLKRLTDNMVEMSEFAGILSRLTNHRMSQSALIHTLQLHLKAWQMNDLARSGVFPATPGAAWEYYRRLHQRIHAQVTALPASEFVSQVDPPTETEIQEMFARYKDQLPSPASPEPGFKLPARAAFEYVTADRDAILNNVKAGITQEEVEAYYQEHREEFKRVLPSGDGGFTPSDLELEGPGAADLQPPGEPPAPADSGAQAPSDAPGAAGEQPPEAAPEVAEPPEGEVPAEPTGQDEGNRGDPSEEAPAVEPEVPDQQQPNEGPAEANGAGAAEADTQPGQVVGPQLEDAGRNDHRPPVSGVTRPVALLQPPETGADPPPADPPAAESPEAPSPAAQTEEGSAPEAGEAQPAGEPSGEEATSDETAADQADTGQAGTDQADAGAAGGAETDAGQAAGGDGDAEQPAGQPAAEAEGATGQAAGEDAYRPLDEVADTIRDRIAAPLVSDQISEALAAVRAAMQKYYTEEFLHWQISREQVPESTPKEPPPRPDLEALAAEHGLQYGEVPLVGPLEVQKYPLGRAQAFNTSGGFSMVSFVEVAYSEELPLFQPEEMFGEQLGSHFLFWKVEVAPERVPRLEEVREEVAEAIRMQRAFDIALKKSQELAQQVQKSGQDLREYFGDSRPIVETGEFTWLTSGSTGTGRPMISDVPGVEMAGMTFMEDVFAVAPGTAVATSNQPKTAAYVVYVLPGGADDAALRNGFLRNGLQSRDLQTLAAMHVNQVVFDWYQQLRARYALTWEREPLER